MLGAGRQGPALRHRGHPSQRRVAGPFQGPVGDSHRCQAGRDTSLPPGKALEQKCSWGGEGSEEVFTDFVATCARRWASVKGTKTEAPGPGSHRALSPSHAEKPSGLADHSDMAKSVYI